MIKIIIRILILIIVLYVIGIITSRYLNEHEYYRGYNDATHHITDQIFDCVKLRNFTTATTSLIAYKEDKIAFKVKCGELAKINEIK